MEQPCLRPIGVLHGDIETIEDAPKNFSISDRVGTLEIFPEYLDGLDGIEVGQTIVVLFWLDRASRDVLKVYPRGDRSRGLRGVFATRSPVRPNPALQCTASTSPASIRRCMRTSSMCICEVEGALRSKMGRWVFLRW